MKLPMHKNQSASAHQFTMVPRSDVPRSSFIQQHTHKTTLDGGYLIPIYVNEVLPGDAMNMQMTAFARLATPIFPVMDNLHINTSFFFVPYRLLWTNFKKMMGEQANPADSISYTVPQMVSKASGYDIGSLHDYMGLPTLGQLTAAQTVTHSSLPLRAYNLIWNEWYRDENIQNSVTVDTGDGPDTYSNYTLLRRGKRKDYFTSALPWPQKATSSVALPLGTSATVKTSSTELFTGAGKTQMKVREAASGGFPGANYALGGAAADGSVYFGTAAPAGVGANAYPTNLYADLTTATAATINQLRQSIAIQQLLEKDARGGTRYTEQVRQQFGVVSPDARLQRPEFLGGADSPIIVNPIAQTTATGLTGGSTPLGNLSGTGAGLHRTGFSGSFTEHGVILGLLSIRADLTYQQGIARWWNRLTRYDFYTPVFANLGEQTILNKEIYCKGDGDPNDALVFGYQERWAEYRFYPNMITGLFRSTAASTIDPWHLAQKFTSLPTLNTTFIQDTPPISRVLAVGAAANGQQFLLDTVFTNRMARPMPMYSVPGLRSL